MDKIKEQINDRLGVLRQCLGGSEKDDWGYIDMLDHHMANEIEFLERLLETVEKQNG